MKLRIGIGVDVGGTYTKIVAVSPRGRILGDIQVPTLPEEGPRPFVLRASAAIAALGAKLGGIRSVGLGLAGDVDGEKGVLRFSPNLGAFTGFGFKAAFESRLGVSIAVDNDANMAAWGGYVFDLGRKPSHVACLTLGTGIGGGLIIGGRLHHGATGTAGEIGHMCVEPSGVPCHCGARGCLEAYAGAYGLLRTAKTLARGSNGRKSLLFRWNSDPDGWDTRLLALAARRGDPLARQVWDTAGTYLGIGIANLTYLLNPEAVFLTGGVSNAGTLLLRPIHRVLQSRPFKRPFRKVRVLVSRTSRLGALGAAHWGLELIQKPTMTLAAPLLSRPARRDE